MKYVTLRLSRSLAKFIRRATGVDFRVGKRKLSRICAFEPPCRVSGSVETRTPIEIGAFSDVGGILGEGHISSVRIGRYCSIAAGCYIGLQQHPTNFLSTCARQYFGDCCEWDSFSGSVALRPFQANHAGSVIIGNDVWIGSNALVMGGITIGDGAIIAAGAVVTKDVPPYAIVGGIPAKVIRYRFDEPTIRELQELKWWDYNLADLGDVPWDDVRKAISAIRARISSGDVKPYRPKILKPHDFTIMPVLRGFLKSLWRHT